MNDKKDSKSIYPWVCISIGMVLLFIDVFCGKLWSETNDLSIRIGELLGVILGPVAIAQIMSVLVRRKENGRFPIFAVIFLVISVVIFVSFLSDIYATH